jgi:cytochrome c553
MKPVVLLAAIVLAGCSVAREPAAAPASTATSSGLSNAEILYGYRCKGCHEPATPGAPNRKELAALEQREIIDALRTGPMKPLATGLTKQEVRELATFLTSNSSKQALAK